MRCFAHGRAALMFLLILNRFFWKLQHGKCILKTTTHQLYNLYEESSLECQYGWSSIKNIHLRIILPQFKRFIPNYFFAMVYFVMINHRTFCLVSDMTYASIFKQNKVMVFCFVLSHFEKRAMELIWTSSVLLVSQRVSKNSLKRWGVRESQPAASQSKRQNMKKKRIWGREANGGKGRKGKKGKEKLGIRFLTTLLFLAECGEMLAGFSVVGVRLIYCIFYHILPQISPGLDSYV